MRFPFLRPARRTVPPETTKPAGPPAPARNVVAEARGARPAAPASRVLDFVKGWTIPIVLFLVVRTFLLEAFRIPSPSMVPEMLVGDWLFVNKLAYG
ncbi:MAG: S26 family signal peptidase, partial [Gemmatimonadaceae bacterium]|nr:S26 family signal peptidase [Gemmatimonadaceae bacterium]